MAEQTAPTKQLLITKDNVTEVVNRICIKKSSIVNPEIVNSLRHLVDVVERTGKSPERMLAIFLMRKEILENASELYIQNDEDILFSEAIEELETILQILEEYTMTK